jgi:hypothetical protein
MTVIPLEQDRLRIDDLLNDVVKGEEVVIMSLLLILAFTRESWAAIVELSCRVC